MGIGGILAKLAMVKDHKYEVQCSRCGLYYNTKKTQECPHCSNLGDSELAQLQSRKENEREGNRQLGLHFLIVAVAVLVVFVVLVLAAY